MFTQNEAGGISYFLPSYQHLPSTLQELNRYFIVRIMSQEEKPGIMFTLREDGKIVYMFFLNTNRNKTVSCKVKTRYTGRPYRWNFDLGESQPFGQWHIQKDELYFDLHLQPAESALFVIDRSKSTRIWQLVESDLDGCQIIKQDRDHFVLRGWKREEAAFRLLVGKGKLQEDLNYEVKNKLPILAISSQGWYFESEPYEGKINLGNLSLRFPSLIKPVTYNKIIILKKPYTRGQKLILDLGTVRHWCTLYVNDQFVAQKLTPPWQFDITDYLHEGENRISIQVMNNLSNALSQNSTLDNFRYPLLDFGLFGPVKLIPYTIFDFEV